MPRSFDAPLVTSPTKRLGVSLNIDTGYNKGKGKELSPPQTPDGPRKAKSNTAAANRALRVKTSPMETFLDDNVTPVDPQNKENEGERGRINRDSHDLSLSPRNVTRDSLVDHMLMSLDQFSFDHVNFGEKNPTVEEEQLYSSFNDEEDQYQPRQNFSPRQNSRTTHNYSYSSDYENADDSSRYSEQMSRGRRSNSGSNYQPGLSRIQSMRRDTTGSQTLSSPRGPSVHIPARGSHSRSAKGSKGSSAASFDLGYAQVTSNQRWAHGLAGRSSSFDYGSDRQNMGAQASAIASRVNSDVEPFQPDDYDAAPTPTIPGGPRRTRPISPILVADPPTEPAPRIERKKSGKSARSVYKPRATTATGSGRFDYGLQDRSRELPALPAFNKEEPAPAPLVGYGKVKESSPVPTPHLKERPGFFRRVFGSSRTNSVAAPEALPSHGSTTSVETTDHPSSKPQQNGTQMKPHNVPPPPPPPKEQPHILSKKPSSFFRRRKKSVSEPEPPLPVPIVPTLLPAEREFALLPNAEASPVSSLRKVMNPYIQSPIKQLKQSHTQSTLSSQVSDTSEDDLEARDVKTFSPSYTPEKNATIRAVKPSSEEGGERLSHYEPLQKANGIPESYASQARDENGTFLQDSSDTGDNHSSTEKPSSVDKFVESESRKASIGVPISPTNSHAVSVSRDKALVAEYERVYSKRSPSATARASSPAANPSPNPNSVKPDQPAPKMAAEEEWVVLSSSKSPPVVPPKDNRVWLEPSSSDEDVSDTKLAETNLALPANSKAGQRISDSTITPYKSTNSLPIVQVEVQDGTSPRLLTATEALKELEELQIAESTPTVGEREKAQKIYDGNEDFIQKEKACAWMGEEGLVRHRTLMAYMELYDFSNLNILAALRALCGRLVLKGESQQVDRILDEFAQRWCKCNPDHGFKVTDVVHTICYSILLLNTDLHMADIDQKMTRSQFIKNTMPTIRRSIADMAPDAFEPIRPTILPGRNQSFGSDGILKLERPSVELERPTWRQSFKPIPRSDSESGVSTPTPLDYDTPSDDCGPLVKAPFHGTLRTWEVQVEIVLKDFYQSIRSERLPLFGSPVPHHGPSSNSLSVFTTGMLRRSPSVLSKAPSESASYMRGKTSDGSRGPHGKWASKNRSRPRLYPSSGLGSSRTSLDDQSSMWSPSVSSSTWSKYSLGKTQTSMSVDSFGSSWPNNDYQQSIGFASALSQAIIREEIHTSTSSTDEHRVAPLLEDESLELAGAPWAKEGIVKHKHHLEALDKKSKDRNWTETFAVIEKGYMSLFSFSSKSLRQKTKAHKAAGQTVVGGGNWQENAESLGSFLLRQTIASALPSPGYSKARPHVWALSLPTGAVHLFQVGTPDIVKEFVSTANYWSARLSNHPLVGGISNIEYGWSDAIVNNALVSAINDPSRPSTNGPRPSMQSSIRTSLDKSPTGVVRGRLPGDRIHITDWSPPTQSMRASNLMETDQLRTLTAYVAGIEEELQKHNQWRSPMQLAFTPRHPNAMKAMANWEKKSSYLLREIVKFRTYIDILQSAEAARERIYAERAKEKEMMERGEEEASDEGETTNPQ
ncbi:PH and SEC7 domain-containing protein C11E3.11c [Phlyctema vagabunda]|uniref:PH and SEC7 domain-containing protein C11E3.11c n=1 Tax=Phlyctema vagabunda TaxID=108571 RepID=A0ABR4PSQ9_9HELO